MKKKPWMTTLAALAAAGFLLVLPYPVMAHCDTLQKTLTEHLAAGLKERFTRAVETKKHAGESVAAGREFVETYVVFIHYAEGLVDAIHGAAGHGEGQAEAVAPKPAACGHKGA